MAKPKPERLTKQMFRDPSGQTDFFEKSLEEELEMQNLNEVQCLGVKFQDDEARRTFFLKKLREKLRDMHCIAGFPIGSDEDILSLSDPPYYTACPNPFIEEFIRRYGKPYDSNLAYNREPLSADVTEGKNDPVYKAHSYHTKVPHRAVMRYLLHYTEPGDFVLDGFCGTGMTGVAAQLCASEQAIRSLGYHTTSDGAILDSGENRISAIGVRSTIQSDLSPIATFIAHNYAEISALPTFANEALKLISEVDKELGWLYEGVSGGQLISAVWSDVFICPNCSHEFVFWEAALKQGKLRDSFPCPHCKTIVSKAPTEENEAVKLERSFTTAFDPVLKKPIRVPRLVLVQETVKKGSTRKITNIKTDEERSLLSCRFEGRRWPHIPADAFFPGRQTNKLINGSGISYICHMYTQRALFAYGSLWERELSSAKHTALFRFCLSAINNYISRKQGYFGGGGGVSGTLFTPSVHLERNVFDVLKRKIKKLRTVKVGTRGASCVSTQSIVDLRNLPSEAIDYIFTDPPFGESLQYAELNMFLEAWLRVRTVVEEDCVLNYVHKKDLTFYSEMMLRACGEYARVLKPGRWITIEFHNSQNAVWSAIQQAIESSGLVVADVRVLDKKQRGFNAVNRAGAVDKDLVISAYKPNGGLLGRFELEKGSEDGVWDFARTHLRQLPVFVDRDGSVEIVAERQAHLLYDRMVAFHVQRGVTVPLSAGEFYAGLSRRFSERDGMYFLPEQTAEYDRKRMKAREVLQLELFVVDESTAIQWLKQQLTRKPQTFPELSPQFMREIAGWEKHEKPVELREMLEQNFLCYDGAGDVPSQIHSYLSTNFKELRNLSKDSPALQSKAKDRWYVADPNKSQDLEKVRERALLREFDDYLQVTQKKLKVFRLEAIRAGFKRAWQQTDYATILNVARKIPEDVLQEDPMLLMWYTNALTRTGTEQ